MVQILDNQGNPKCCENTIRNQLHDFGFYSRRRHKKKAVAEKTTQRHSEVVSKSSQGLECQVQSALDRGILFPEGEQYVWCKVGLEFTKRGI